MLRKIVFNIILSFLLYPLIFFIKDLILVNPENLKLSSNRSDLTYIHAFLNNYIDPFLSFAMLLLLLLPFQLAKDYYFKKNKTLNFLKKYLGFFALSLFSIIVGMLSVYGMFRTPFWLNYVYVLFCAILSLVSTLFLYVTVDRYAEKKGDNMGKPP